MDNLIRFLAIIVAFLVITGNWGCTNPFIVGWILPCPPGTVSGDYGACNKTTDLGHN